MNQFKQPSTGNMTYSNLFSLQNFSNTHSVNHGDVLILSVLCRMPASYRELC